MRRSVLVPVVAAIAFIYPQSSICQWVGCNGFPASAYVACFAYRGSTIYAGLNSGIAVSTDGGNNWTDMWPTSLHVNTLIVDTVQSTAGSAPLYAATSGGIFVSTNGGSDWTKSGPNEDDSTFTALLATGGYIFAGTDSGLVYLSSDGGLTWISASNGLPGSYITSLAALDGVTLAGTENGVFRSTDSGTNWSAPDTELSGKSIYEIAADDTLVFAIADGRVYRSTNLGKTWVESDSGIGTSLVNRISVGGSTDIKRHIVCAITSNNVFVSLDDGSTWTKAGNPEYSTYIGGVLATGIAIFVSRYIPSRSIMRSTDDGATWSNVDASLASGVSKLAAIGNRLFASSSYDLFESMNAGQSWMEVAGGFFPENKLSVVDCWSVGNRLLVEVNAHTLYESADSGKTFTLLDSSFYANGGTFNENPGGLFYALITTGWVVRSTDGGSSWAHADSGILGSNIFGLVSLPYSPTSSQESALFAATSHGVFRSTDNGGLWTQAINGMTDTSANELIASGTDLYVLTRRNKSGPSSDGWYSHIFRSTNLGSSWSEADSGITSLSVTDIVADTNSSTDLLAGSEFVTGGYGGYLLLSTDGGTTWAKVDSIDGASIIPELVSGTNLYAFNGTYSNNLLRHSLLGITSVKESSVSRPPEGFVLQQNYPNPFNPITDIEFYIPHESRISLKVYDVLGRVVSVLASGRIGPGEHAVKFDGGPLASGVYFCRLDGRSFSKTIKMLLLK